MILKAPIKSLLVLSFVFLVAGTSVPVESSDSATLQGVNIADTQGCTYWITKSTGKRHNSSCRWYRKSKGYCTDDRIGIACKICGG